MTYWVYGRVEIDNQWTGPEVDEAARSALVRAMRDYGYNGPEGMIRFSSFQGEGELTTVYMASALIESRRELRDGDTFSIPLDAHAPTAAEIAACYRLDGFTVSPSWGRHVEDRTTEHAISYSGTVREPGWTRRRDEEIPESDALLSRIDSALAAEDDRRPPPIDESYYDEMVVTFDDDTEIWNP